MDKPDRTALWLVLVFVMILAAAGLVALLSSHASDDRFRHDVQQTACDSYGVGC